MKRYSACSTLLMLTLAGNDVWAQAEAPKAPSEPAAPPAATAPEPTTPAPPAATAPAPATPTAPQAPAQPAPAQPAPAQPAPAQPAAETPAAAGSAPAAQLPASAASEPGGASTDAQSAAGEASIAVGVAPAVATSEAPAEKKTKPSSEVTLQKKEKGGIALSGDDDSGVSLGLTPGAPQVATLPGGVTPAFGQSSGSASDWRFDFHGILLAPLRIGIGERENALQGQKVTTLHGQPVVSDSFETFEYTSANPQPWVQLNFSYGNSDVTATVIVAARSMANANAYFNAPDHIGVNDAFLTYRWPISESAVVTMDVGAFSQTYGNLGEYDLGRYGTPVIARIGGMGATARGHFDMGDWDLITEAGMMGQLNKAPVGVEPAGWNGFADPNVGTSFVAHGHALGYFNKAVSVSAHALHAFAQDDRAARLPENPDGSITVLGADLRLTMSRFGHLYLGYGHTAADTARTVSGVIRVLNAPGGPGLRDEYFGPDSDDVTGSLDTLGLQYDFSLGNFLRVGNNTVGDGPDLILSPFMMMTMVSSEDKTEENGKALYDGVTKLKFGGEVTYNWLKWLAAGLRYDRVMPDIDNTDRTHAVLTPRLIFRSDWDAQDQVALQYSRWFNGSQTTVISGYPPERDPTVKPDEHSVSLTASMWW